MSNVSLIKVGGICAILYAVLMVVATILSVASGVEGSPDNIEVFLRSTHNNAMFISAISLRLVAGALIIPASLGFYQALREAGRRLLWSALTTTFVGMIIQLVAVSITLGIVLQLALGYAETSETVRPALAVVGRTLVEPDLWAGSLGVFLGSIGVLLFGIGVVRTSVIRHWIGWLGVVAGVLSAFSILAYTADVFVFITVAGWFLILVRTVAMAVSLLRLREPAASTTGA